MIYLDNAASTPPSEFILEQQKELLSNYFANPDATHEAGYQSLIAVNRAEKLVLELTHATASAKVIWMSTATEAINLAITVIALNSKRVKWLPQPLNIKPYWNPLNGGTWIVDYFH